MFAQWFWSVDLASFYMWFIVFFLPVLSSARWKCWIGWLSKLTANLLSMIWGISHVRNTNVTPQSLMLSMSSSNSNVIATKRLVTQSSVFTFREHCYIQYIFRTLPFSPSVFCSGMWVQCSWTSAIPSSAH